MVKDCPDGVVKDCPDEVGMRTDLMEWSRYDGVVKYWWSGLGAPQVIREVVRPGIVVTDS